MSASTPGSQGKSARTPGPSGPTGPAPDPPKTSTPAPGTSPRAPGPPGRTATLPDSQRRSLNQPARKDNFYSWSYRKVGSCYSPGTTADHATDPSGASSREQCGKCEKLYTDSYRYKCKIDKCHCTTDLCSFYCHQNWRNLWGYQS